MKRIIFFFLLFLSIVTHAGDSINVYPTHWWVGMKDTKLQLIIHNTNDYDFSRTIFRTNSADVKLVKLTKPENNHYLIADLLIGKNAKPQTLVFTCDDPRRGQSLKINYELKARNSDNGRSRVQGVTSADFIYLLMPDRFSNGDAANDIVDSYRDKVCDRRDSFSRHGGDFTGIINHLDYFNQLGVTTLWLTPVIENDMPRMTEHGNQMAGYHGYWFTDHYNIDKRLGGNEGYKKFCNLLHQRGMKVIQDAVYNHVGNHHWFALDPPMKDWFNTSQGNKPPNHREEVFYDPYASAYDKQQMLDGWFVPHLPDLNQRNPYVANFLIQHAIWTTEEYGIDGWRVDTYKYCEEKFMNDVNVALEREFPRITIFGESWVNTTIANAYFTRNNINAPFKHNAGGMLDFQVCFAMLAGMNEAFGWMTGVNKIYNTLAGDILYKEPRNNCIFLDNHDMDRVFSVVNEDWKKLKMGINWLLTLRGIPQIYYGTEVLMKNKKNATDAPVREDYPGGWDSDNAAGNRFIKQGRTDTQNIAFEYISSLAGFRKSSSALTTGKTMQYISKEGLYVYFRYDAKQTVMVITNSTSKEITPDLTIYAERLTGFSRIRDVVTGNIRPLTGLTIEAKNSVVYEVMK